MNTEQLAGLVDLVGYALAVIIGIGFVLVAGLVILYLIAAIWGKYLRLSRENRKAFQEKDMELAKLLGDKDRITTARLEASRELTEATRKVEEEEQALARRRVELAAEMKAAERGARRDGLGKAPGAPAGDSVAITADVTAIIKQVLNDELRDYVQELSRDQRDNPLPERAGADPEERDSGAQRRHKELIAALDTVGIQASEGNARIGGLVDMLETMLSYHLTKSGASQSSTEQPGSPDDSDDNLQPPRTRHHKFG